MVRQWDRVLLFNIYSFPKLLPYMQNQAIIFEDREDLLGKSGEVIRITFVSHNTVLKLRLGSSLQFSSVVE